MCMLFMSSLAVCLLFVFTPGGVGRKSGSTIKAVKRVLRSGMF